MTKDEARILGEVANDIKWLKQNAEKHSIEQVRQLSEINQHLIRSNGSVTELYKRDAQRYTDIKWLRRIMWTIIIVLLGGGITSLAELQGLIQLGS